MIRTKPIDVLHSCIDTDAQCALYVNLYTRETLDPGGSLVLDRSLIICQLAHSRLRTRDTSIYRATNISICVVFARAALDLFILERSSHRLWGWFIILVQRPSTASYLVALASIDIQGVSQVYIKLESYIPQKFKI